jgi:hypothetical protein
MRADALQVGALEPNDTTNVPNVMLFFTVRPD